MFRVEYTINGRYEEIVANTLYALKAVVRSLTDDGANITTISKQEWKPINDKVFDLILRVANKKRV
jgi:hypothetical protein